MHLCIIVVCIYMIVCIYTLTVQQRYIQQYSSMHIHTVCIVYIILLYRYILVVVLCSVSVSCNSHKQNTCSLVVLQQYYTLIIVYRLCWCLYTHTELIISTYSVCSTISFLPRVRCISHTHPAAHTDMHSISTYSTQTYYFVLLCINIISYLLLIQQIFILYS